MRDILRNHTSDHGLEVSVMGSIEDMSGLNDAFNSTICRLKVEVKPSAFNQQGKSPKQQQTEDQDPKSGASSQPEGATKGKKEA